MFHQCAFTYRQLETFRHKCIEPLYWEPIGVKSHYFGDDLAIFRKNYSQG